jgi:biopolymer transport protein ExbD
MANTPEEQNATEASQSEAFDPASVLQAAPTEGDYPLPEGDGEGTLRRRKKKRADEDKLALNINSLMDIMTILLVFLLKSYSADPVQIKPAPGLQLPFAHSEMKPVESTNVTLTLGNIIVDEKKVVSLEEGKVNPADMQGDFLIQPLLDALADSVEHQKKIAKYNKKAEFSGIVTIIADRDVPFNLLTKVMYTAGQASFGKFKFAVVKMG